MCPVHMGSNNPTHSITLKKLTVWHYYEIVLKLKQNKTNPSLTITELKSALERRHQLRDCFFDNIY